MSSLFESRNGEERNMQWTMYGGVVIATILLFYNLNLRLRKKPVDPREPVFLYPKIPVIGHIIGLFQYGGAYYTRISEKTRLPIYSLPLGRTKFYVVNSLPLILTAGKVSKKLSFIPFVKIAAERLSGLGPEALEKFDADGEVEGVAADTIHGVEIALLGKNEAVELDEAVLEHMKILMDELPVKLSKSKEIGLLEWLQHVITQASSRSVYGPLNPLQDQETEDKFWEFEHNLGLLLLNFAPDMFKQKAIAAREKVVAKFHAYYQAHGQDQGSPLARARFAAPAKYGLSLEEIARLEVPFNFAVLNNTVAAAFWMLSQIYSRPETLTSLRSELSNVITASGSSSRRSFSVSMADLKTKCPVLLAAFHEVLRVYSVRPNIRQVTEDTLLDDKYFLEKGSIVQMSTKAIHEDPSYWGLDAKSIDLKRFLDRPNGGNLTKNTAAFGTFGVAPHICPGRHFAATEILSITVQVVMRYDMVPAQGSKTWSIPKQNLKGFNGVTGPIGEMPVEFTERKEWSGDWKYSLGEEGLKFPLASG